MSAAAPGSPQEKPDPLDRIEAKIANETRFSTVVISKEQAEALVEIARAARGVMTQMDYETPHHTRLRAALARLDNHA